MLDVGVLLLQLALPLVLAWTTASIVTGLAFERLTNANPLEDERVGLEAWLLYAAMGAAAGGLCGTMLVLRDLALATPAANEVGRLLMVAAPGMVLGATFACGVVMAVMQLRR